MATKYDLTDKQIGKLKVIRLCSIKERPTQTHGNYWLCKCDCGNYCKVPTSYLTGNGNYTQTSCGCDRKKKAFQATTYIEVGEDFLNEFKEDFEKYLFLHKALRITHRDLFYYNNHIEEYKTIIRYFWQDEQFNKVYQFWNNNKNKNKTFYDWAKPSLDHIIPVSKGGEEKLENYQFLTVYENFSKRDMTMEEWNDFKIKTNTTSDYFIDKIMNSEGGLELE